MPRGWHLAPVAMAMGRMGAVAAWPRDLLASAGAAVFAALSHRLMNGFFLS